MIAQLDETLTMSARMAAATGDEQWEARYTSFAPELDEQIQEAQCLAPDLFSGAGAREADEANRALVAIEHRAFDLVRAGDRPAAAALLSSPAYEENKKLYSDGLGRLRAGIGKRVRDRLAAERRRLIQTFAVTACIVPLLIAAWVTVVRAGRRLASDRQRVEERFRRFFELSADLVCIAGIDGYFRTLNASWTRVLGYSREELLAKPFVEFVHSDDRAATRGLFEEKVKKGVTIFTFCNRYLRADGRVAWLEWTSQLSPGAHEVFAIARDVTGAREAEGRLRAQDAGLRAILASTADGILGIDQERKVVHANRRFHEIWRIPQPLAESRDDGALLAFVLSQLTDPAAFLAKVEALYGSDLEDMDVLDFKDGRVVERYSSPMIAGETVVGRVWSFRDVTERRRAEGELRLAKESVDEANREITLHLEHERELSQTDGLTGLCNRRHFFELAARELTVANRYSRPLSIVMIDVDRLKEANDSFGHLFGDQVLLAVAQTARSHVRDSDVLARFGGDEFVLMLPETTALQALPLVERIREQVAERSVRADSGVLRVTLSIGIAELATQPPDAGIESVVRRADQALYAAKGGGRNRAVLWEPEPAVPQGTTPDTPRSGRSIPE